MSKTPYEIRLELLKLAKDSLYEPVFQKRQNLYEEFMSKREVFVGMPGPTEEQLALQFPVMPDFPPACHPLSRVPGRLAPFPAVS